MNYPKLGQLAILSLAATFLAGPSAAYDPIVEKQGWPQIDFDRNGRCAGEIRGNGKIFLVNVSGLGSAASGRYYLANQDMKPIDAPITANGEGEWSNYYVPFLPNYDAGTVWVVIETDQCRLNLSFDWDAYGVQNYWTGSGAMGG